MVWRAGPAASGPLLARGTRCRTKVPHGHWNTTPLVCGLRLHGLSAPMVIDGAMDGVAISAYAESFLARSLAEGDVVVLDALAAHKVKGVREAMARTGATLLYLPPCAPGFNPIEQAFAKHKALFRRAAARSVDGLESAPAKALESFSLRNARTTSPMREYKQLDPKMLQNLTRLGKVRKEDMSMSVHSAIATPLSRSARIRHSSSRPACRSSTRWRRNRCRTDSRRQSRRT